MHIFNATYSGDLTFSAASLTGAAPSVVISGVPTVTTLFSTDANPSAANSTLLLVATVTPNQVCAPPAPCPTGAAPGGKVQFKDGTMSLGIQPVDRGMNTGSAPSATAALTLDRNTLAKNTTHSITATYIPDGTRNYIASTSTPLTITVGSGVGEGNSVLTLTTTPAGAVNFVDMSVVTFIAKATNQSASQLGKPTGTVTFFSNGTTLGTATLVSPGIWSFTIPQNDDSLLELPLGQSRILAQYSGDAKHAASSARYPINVYDQNSTPDFAMQSNVTYQTLSAGNRSAKFALQFTSMNNLSTLKIPITLTYTAPMGITCNGSAATPNFGGKLYATVNYTCKSATGVKIGQLSMPGCPNTGRNSHDWWIAGAERRWAASSSSASRDAGGTGSRCWGRWCSS